jgi:hydrogen cyanide synthase HcnC
MRQPKIIVVGGGVIGCAVTYQLAKKHVSVLLLDDRLPGRATSASAGGLWPIGEAVGLGCGVIFHATQTVKTESSLQGSGPQPLPDVFRDYLILSNARFPELAPELRELSGVDIEYAPGAGLLFVVFDEKERAFVKRVAQAPSPGLAVEVLSAEEVARLEPHLTRTLLGGALLRGEHQVNPMFLAEAFRRAALKPGADLRHHSRVSAIRREGQRVTGVEIGGEFLPCGTVVNAAGAWSASLAASAGLHLPLFPVRGQIVLTEAMPPVLNTCLSASTCYLAQKVHGEVLIGSTTENAGFDVSAE